MAFSQEQYNPYKNLVKLVIFLVSSALTKFYADDTLLIVHKRINIGNKEKAINDISQFSFKNYRSVDIEFFNIHLKVLNKTLKKNIFDKNNLYIRSSTLWELMQKEGNKGKHNFHGLTPNQIYDVLKGLLTPFCVYYSENKRIVITTFVKNTRNEKIQLVLELHSPLENNRNANINKIVSIYPKKNLDNKLSNLKPSEILFI